MDSMIITIITAVYNNCAHIEDCIKSVLSQSYPHIEFIVIDGGSTDGTLNIIDKYKSQISCVKSESDKGMYDALNKGIKLATGNVIGFLHSDDFFYNQDVVSQIVKAFENNNIDGLYSDLQYVDKNNTNTVIRFWKSKPYNFQMLRIGWMPPHPTLFLNSKVYQETGSFNLKYKIAADYDFMVRVLKNTNYKFEYLPIIVTRMRVGGASNKSIQNVFKKSWEDYLIIKRNKIGGFCTLFLKNFTKLGQFLKR
jgi:glycosyltransferase involved in cell wall biosynthesis